MARTSVLIMVERLLREGGERRLRDLLATKLGWGRWRMERRCLRYKEALRLQYPHYAIRRSERTAHSGSPRREAPILLPEVRSYESFLT